MLPTLVAVALQPSWFRGPMRDAHYFVDSDLMEGKSPYWTDGPDQFRPRVSHPMAELGVSGTGVTLQVVADPGRPNSNRMLIVLANGTDDTVMVPSECNNLNIVRQARDRHGVWRPVEFKLHGMCGNAYYNVALFSGRAWAWECSTYTGPFATKCRYILTILGRQRDSDVLSRDLVSPEFDARIDPKEFKVPRGLADSFEVDPDGSLLPRRDPAP